MKFYITTPIYYVNDQPHIGSSYTTIVADVLARYHKLFNDDVFFLTGTDEHGQKVQAAALKANLSPQDHVDRMVDIWENVWKELNIQPDIFMRTTYPFHKEYVQSCMQKLYDEGEIYLKEYEGWYSVSEEIFYTEKDLINGKSPGGKEVTKISEKNYFFRMSKYQNSLIEYIEKNPEYIQPAGKRSEVLGFLRQPLEDLCISRPKSRLTWGIDLPFDNQYVTYVWADALLNYRSALYEKIKDQAIADQFWINTHHLLGKDILTTHAVYWSTILMALKLPLPKTILAHGWWLNDTEQKMSKSEGKVISPLEVAKIVGVDGLRYFLVRDIYLGNDAKFSIDLVVSRVNSELANKLGNLFSRTSKLLAQNFDSKISSTKITKTESQDIFNNCKNLAKVVQTSINNLEPNLAIGHIIDLLDQVNRYLDLFAPWKAVKTDPELAAETLYTALAAIRVAACLLHPVMPNKMDQLLKEFGVENNSILEANPEQLKQGTEIKSQTALFPRVQI